jgi:hypothetical protein
MKAHRRNDLERPKKDPGERRDSVRFPLALEARYSVAHGETGLGRIVDISKSGLRFSLKAPLPPGRRLDVAINWPVLLDGRVQLQLLVTGRVVWSNGSETALRIYRHAFRTRGVGLSPATKETEFDSAASDRDDKVQWPEGMAFSGAAVQLAEMARLGSFGHAAGKLLG